MTFVTHPRIAGWFAAHEATIQTFAFLLVRLLNFLSTLISMKSKLTHGFRGRFLATTYPKCSESSTKQFIENLSEASDSCATTTSYDWGGDPNPTDEQRTEICNCTVDAFEVPKCYWTKQGKDDVSTAVHFKFVYNCDSDVGEKMPEVTEVEVDTPAPAPTTATPTAVAPKPEAPTTGATAPPKTAAPTAPPVTAAPGLPDCTVQQLSEFTTRLTKASSGCMSDTSYYWGGDKNPTDSQYEEICKCTSSVKDFSISDCSIQKGDYKVTLAVHYDWVKKTQCPTFSPPVKSNPSSSGTDTGTTVAQAQSSSNIGMIAGIAGGVVAVVLIIGLIICKRNRRDRKEEEYTPRNDMRSPVAYQPADRTPSIANGNKYTDPRQSCLSDATYTSSSTASSHVRASGANSRGSRGLNSTGGRIADNNIRNTAGSTWDDPAIVAARIPYDTIFFGPLLSSGGFGEVFRGTYRGETVAIKQLLPARRKDLKQIDDFLGEVKLVSSLEHERIVKFIGVAWNSLSDACMVVEFMDNGDLRSVLTRWNEGDEQRSHGFDADKIKIAMHVAHALTYLHSMQPVVVHRDLKSKNILLDANFDAKVTDFGVSRERAESTMTAGVGSSLWMAPEVMMGERYNEKADVFSFGVVLSELDTHQLPYFDARVSESGQQIPETAILQQVMLGRLSVRFTDRADPAIVQLGRECIGLDPRARPSAAHVLHRMHQIMQDWRRGTALI